MEQDLFGRLMADMDPELLGFVQANVGSFLKWDLICFFHDNPYTMDTAESIAWYTGRDTETVRAELSELAAQGVLVQRQLRDRLGEMTIYSLSDNAQLRALIRRFVEASDDRQFRAEVIYYVVRSMRKGAHLPAQGAAAERPPEHGRSVTGAGSQ